LPIKSVEEGVFLVKHLDRGVAEAHGLDPVPVEEALGLDVRG
jgi:hypothetical protein